MTRSATDVMQEVIFAAVIDSLAAMKAASKGLPNNLLRDLNAIHGNTTFADLPRELQASINASVRAAFTRLLKEGYTVSSGQPPPPRPMPPRREGSGHGRGQGRPPPRRDGQGPGKPPRNGPRPNRKPRPRGK